MNLQGDFDGLFLANILQLLCDDKKNGFLQVTSGDKESKVFFKDGAIIYATSSKKEYRLGAILRRNGLITEEQLGRCLDIARERKEAMGKVLVDTECITLDNLKKYSTQQVEDILYDMLLWKHGRFEYKDAQFSLERMVISQLSPMKLILEASRRIDEMSVLTDLISSENLVFKMSGKTQEEEIKLNANEWRILSLVDGIRTVRELVDQSGYDEFAVYKILYSVISYGLVEKIEEISPAHEEKPEEVHLEQEEAKEEEVKKEEAPRESAKAEVAKEQGAKEDYSAIVTVFCDILHAVQKNLKTELGSGAAAIFEECKEALDPPFQRIFSKFHPDYPLNVNIQAFLHAMAGSLDPDRGRNLLIEGFIQYTAAALRTTANLLGNEPTGRIIKDIEKVVDYVDKYQPASGEKDKIVTGVRQAMKNLADELGGSKGKAGSGGFFARLMKH